MFLKRNFGPDRRRRKRQLLNASVKVFTDSGPIEALGINISDVGMSLFTIANLSMDSRIQIELLKPQSTERVRVWGTIRHRALYLYGVEFLAESNRISKSSWADPRLDIEKQKAERDSERQQESRPSNA